MQTGSRAAIALSLVVAAATAMPGRPVAAQRPDAALTHFSHIATGFNGAPGGRGLAVTAAMESNAAMLHANFAAGSPADLEAMKTNVRHVLHALIPAEGGSGPGLGFGLKRAAEAIATHIDLAVAAADASPAVAKIGPTIAVAARAVAARAQALADLANRILATSTAADAAPLVAALRTMALELDTGRDANGNGRIELDAVEPGMNQLEAQIYSTLEGERLARVLR